MVKVKKFIRDIFIVIIFLISLFAFTYGNDINLIFLGVGNFNLPKQVYLGGNLIGLDVKTKGVFVVNTGEVETKRGSVCPAEEVGIQKGDIILSINGISINSPKEIIVLLNEDLEDISSLKIEYKRDNKKDTIEILPALCVISGLYRLGMWVDNGTKGIGTLTYIDPSSREFGALGHPISNKNYEKVFPFNDGNIYNGDLINIIKGNRGKAGQLQGVILNNTKNYLGEVKKNTKFGVFGKYVGGIEDKKLIDVGGKRTALPGKAKIVSYVFNGKYDEFEIEIIKTSYRNMGRDSFVFKVKDEKLINLTGGIVQGMSGSPIIQNGKLIGAVTHVYLNDATKGFGIYVDNMLNVKI